MFAMGPDCLKTRMLSRRSRLADRSARSVGDNVPQSTASSEYSCNTLSASSSPSAAAHVEPAAATSSFGPAEAQVANDNRIMFRVSFALAVFKEKLMTLSPVDDRVVPFRLRFGES